MASYRGHLTFASVLGAAYGGFGVWRWGYDWGPALLAVGLTTVGGLLPDLDSDSGVPVRELFGAAATIVPLLLYHRLRNAGATVEQTAVLLGGLYLLIRYGVSRIFKRYTVHRGMFHSIPGLGVAVLALYLLYHNPDPFLRWYEAGAVGLGFLSHLVLDELYSVDFMGTHLRLNRYAGSALKFWSPSRTATVLTYLILAVLAAAVWYEATWTAVVYNGGMNASSRLSLPMWNERFAAPLAPVSGSEMRACGWDSVDIVFVSGDAYVDHPSFAAALLTRVLEAEGFRVAVLAQPDWRSCEPWRQFGRPRLFFAVSAGNMDSLINHYTANKKVRNDDAYSPGGRIGLRPDRATLPYCHRAREAFPGVPVIAGGVEASLRRLAHYDYWSDTVRRSILLDCKADLVAYGMGEETIVEIARRLAAGKTVRDLRDLRGVAYALGANEASAASGGRQPPDSASCQRAPEAPGGLRPPLASFTADAIVLPSYEQVKADKLAFAEATRLIHINTNPYNAKALVQFHDREAVVANPPCLPLSQAHMDRVYDMPYTRRPHPSYTEPIPAFEMIKDSVTIMRGCFGGCTFCSITAHQGRIIQSRSQESVLKEVRKMAADPEFAGVVSDVGGPTANMYEMRCTRPEVEAICKRLSCVHPTVCKLLGTDHGPLVDLLRRARTEPGIRKVLVASGVRMDLAQMSPEYMRELAEHHVGGHLKVAPEHTDSHVLELMKKPVNNNFEGFARDFKKASQEAGKPKQFIVPYYIASHPGSDLHAMIDLALFLKRNGYRPDQVQDFIPAPFDIAACMYHTGIDPFTKQEVYIARNLRDRKLQRALLQFFKPENYFEVRKALEQAGRTDLIGGGCDALIPAQPPREALRARREHADAALRGDHYHTVANPAKGEPAGERGAEPPTKGYRPGRKSAGRRQGKSKSGGR